MKILLEELKHQSEALDKIISNFTGVSLSQNNKKNYYANDLINDAYEEKSNIDIKMETGERVIIVMGAVCVIKSRVSGTLTKYISCIA